MGVDMLRIFMYKNKIAMNATLLHWNDHNVNGTVWIKK